MDFVRISLMTPRPGQAHEVTRLLAQVIAFCSERRGFRGGLIVGGRPGAGRLIGRVTLWSDRIDADRVAREDHMLALRSQLDALVEAEGHLELALDATTLSGEPGGRADLSPSEAVAIAEGFVRASHSLRS